MDEKELRKSGAEFTVGDDLYGVSVEQLNERLAILQAECIRIEAEIAKKSNELSHAESFFNNS